MLNASWVCCSRLGDSESLMLLLAIMLVLLDLSPAAATGWYDLKFLKDLIHLMWLQPSRPATRGARDVVDKTRRKQEHQLHAFDVACAVARCKWHLLAVPIHHDRHAPSDLSS